MKKCLLISCSNGSSLHKDFAKIFGHSGIEYINLSMGGMGNRYITARLFEYVDDIGIQIMCIYNIPDCRGLIYL